MRIEDVPRPWLLSAMTGVPMSALLEQAERERAERAEVARQNALCEKYARPSAADRRAIHRLIRLIGSTRLAS
jgi:hypothetical protein